jgi:hypothetical protein
MAAEYIDSARTFRHRAEGAPAVAVAAACRETAEVASDWASPRYAAAATLIAAVALMSGPVLVGALALLGILK